ncbi:MAG: Trehalose/maltose import ATP-binding protein MalK [Methanomassiliicoccales archaeon PtaU1.Bin124]|nr:MAG: Trehalose/maltose import ATP-binding protein MalK [Methanomassiliicoccales archaeon PtaU1.Bin124]
MTEQNIVEIEDLYISFHTQSGEVKAIDGVNLTLKKGETFGLVGETGCGKSVTANSIMRLIPQPPGKIEKGRIYFMPPRPTEEKYAEVRQRIEEMKKKISAGGDDKNVQADNQDALKRLEKELADLDELKAVEEQLEMVMKEPDSEQKAAKVAELRDKRGAVLANYNLLLRSKDYMQRIRGKYISMIFQEPMAALNPVFTAGFQIGEVLLLHERKEIAEAALRRVNEETELLRNKHHIKMEKNSKGENECSECHAIIPEEADVCPGCGNYVNRHPLKYVTLLRHQYDRRMLKMIVASPNKWLSKRVAKREMNREAMDRAQRMLRLVRIPDPQSVVRSYPHELSGGMQQRVMIAIALACKPQLLIADEPTTALDVTIQAQILKLMHELQHETGTAILMITHNLGVVAEICDNVGVMYAGTMAEVGSTFSVFKEPLHPYTQGLINSIPKVTKDMPRLMTIEGNVPNLIKPPTGCRFHTRCPYVMDRCKAIKPELQEVEPGHRVACHLYGEVKL